MNCETCGHDWLEHIATFHQEAPRVFLHSLCTVCFHEPHGGPCYPWEFR